MAAAVALLRAALVLPGCLALGAQAQSPYQHSLSLAMGVEYDSNPRLTAEPAGGVSRLILRPRYTLLSKHGSDELQLKLGAALEQSSNAMLSRHRRDGDALLEWRGEAESLSYSLQAGYERSAARTALLEETGQVGGDGTRTVRKIGAQGVRELGERQSLSGSLDMRWVKHELVQLPNHRLTQAELEWSVAHAPGQDWFAAGSLSHYRPEYPAQDAAAQAPGQNSLLRGLMLGYRFKPPGQVPWSWQVRAGAAHYGGPFSDTMVQAEIKLAYQGERWSSSATLARLPVVDNINGAFAPNRQARLRAEYAWTQDTRLAWDASCNRLTGRQSEAARTLGMELSTDISSLWRATAQLRHTQVDRDTPGAGGQASARGASLIFTYLHPDF